MVLFNNSFALSCLFETSTSQQFISEIIYDRGSDEPRRPVLIA
jgi:hypothetical protein